jgi:CubicO group peptidase (beta-lactamase class C family)
MIRTALTAAALLLAVPASAQSEQERLDQRYNRALAAGYKALMLCGAIANAERSGWPERSEQSVLEYELSGIQPPLNAIVGELPYRVERWPSGQKPVKLVEVDWTDDMPPRIAVNRVGLGCSIAPVGMDNEDLRLDAPAPTDPMIATWSMKQPNPLTPVLKDALDARYGAQTRTTAVSVNWGEDGWDWAFADGFTPYTPQRTWSAAKSIAATLVGANEYRGAGLVNSHAAQTKPPSPLLILEWYAGDGMDPRSAISMDHLLRMASGRYSDTLGNLTDSLYFGGSTVRETALHWPLVHQPGTVFRYANNDTLAAIAAIAGTFGEHPPAELFAKLGMNDTVAETDWQGDYVLSSQVWASTMDLIRFGQLYLRDGVLPSGERILPENWRSYVTTPSGPQPDAEFGYGAGFWLMNKSEGIPPDTFAAFGNRGQYVVIVPSCDAVIVRRGEDPAGSRFDIAAFTRDVLAQLDCSEK